MNVGRQQLELHNVDFGQQLLSRSNPYHLCLLRVYFESVTSHVQHRNNKGVLRSNSECSMLMSNDLQLQRQGIEPWPSGFQEVDSTTRPLPLAINQQLQISITCDRLGYSASRLFHIRLFPCSPIPYLPIPYWPIPYAPFPCLPIQYSPTLCLPIPCCPFL